MKYILTLNRIEVASANNTYKKLAVQRLNEALCLVSSNVLADSFRLRNRQLLVAGKTLKCLVGIDITKQLIKTE